MGTSVQNANEFGYEGCVADAYCEYAYANKGRYLYRLKCAARRAQLRKRVQDAHFSYLDIPAARVGLPCPICGSSDTNVTLVRESDGVVRFWDMGCGGCGAC